MTRTFLTVDTPIGRVFLECHVHDNPAKAMRHVEQNLWPTKHSDETVWVLTDKGLSWYNGKEYTPYELTLDDLARQT